MPMTPKTTYLLASHEPALLSAVEPVLTPLGVDVQIVLSAEAALAAMTSAEAPQLALIDVRLPDLDMGRLLAAARSDPAHCFPIVLFSDTISEEMKDRIDEGIVEDVLPANLDPAQLAFRIEMIVRGCRRNQDRDREVELLSTALARNDRIDRLTGAFTRDAMLIQLFRETDRVQRMNTSLCFILFDIDDFGHWNTRLGQEPCDELLVQVVARASRLLRSYDFLGRVGKDEFLAGLPGCSTVNAMMLAERIRAEVFGAPFSVGDTAVRLSACFGVAPSHGRSPVVVLREAEEALRRAREAGPESIHCAADCPQLNPASVAFLSADAGEQLGW